MDGTRFTGWLAAARRSARRLHAGGIFAQQRLHLAALLICAAALPLRAQAIQFEPATTQQEFAQFSRTMGQAIFATPVQPARSSSVLGFDIGVAATLVKVDQNATWWRHAVPANNDFLTGGGYAAVPRLVAIKGLGLAPVSRTYAQVRNSDVKTYGVALFLSKGFGPIPPYAAIGRQRTNASGTVNTSSGSFSLADTSNINRYTAGVRFSLPGPKLVVEVTQAEVRSYAAKVSVGF